jgi:hypothetical protein
LPALVAVTVAALSAFTLTRGLASGRSSRRRTRARSCGDGRRTRRFGVIVIVAFHGASTHDSRPNPLFDDVLLLFLVDGSLHAFDVDWF